MFKKSIKKIERAINFCHKHKVYYYDVNKNMGDLLNEEIFAFMLGEYIRVRPKRARYVMIGSVLDLFLGGKWWDKFKKPLIILGSGFIQPPVTPDVIYRRLEVVGVRGKITRKRLAMLGYEVKDVVLGDWGLVIAKLFPLEKPKQRYDIGLVAHYADESNADYLQFRELLSKRYNVLKIDIKQDFKKFANKMIQCDTIISSAMHGLIVADSYRIPNLRVVFTGSNILGGDYKYNDYYSVFNKKSPQYKSETLFNQADLKKYIINCYEIDSKEVEGIQNNILKEIVRIRDKSKKPRFG